MVRLKGSVKKTLSFAVNSFQFLNGAIKSFGAIIIFLVIRLFQFLNGAIKRTELFLNFATTSPISIPQWCD